MCSKNARPIANFIIWMILNGKLLTKDRPMRYDLINDIKYYFCENDESMDHLFFSCDGSKNIW